MQLSRRDMLKLAGLGAVGAAGLTMPFGREVSGSTISTLATSKMPKPFAAKFQRQPVLTPVNEVKEKDGTLCHYYDVYARPGTANLVAGLPTPVLAYTGSLAKDSWYQGKNASAISGHVPGPIIKADKGTKIVMRMHN